MELILERPKFGAVQSQGSTKDLMSGRSSMIFVDPMLKLEDELITVKSTEVISLDSDDDITDVTDDVTAIETFGQKSRSGKLFLLSKIIKMLS